MPDSTTQTTPIFWEPIVSEDTGRVIDGITIGRLRVGQPLASKIAAFRAAKKMMRSIPNSVYCTVRRCEVNV